VTSGFTRVEMPGIEPVYRRRTVDHRWWTLKMLADLGRLRWLSRVVLASHGSFLVVGWSCRPVYPGDDIEA
jgi:hypothetical protein